MKTVGIVLAAGASRRFGDADKLLAAFDGRPLAAYASQAMRQCSVDHRVAVVGTDAVAELFEDFVRARVPPGAAQSDSLRAGVAEAEKLGADRVVVALADMPLVTAGFIDAVLAINGAACVTDGKRRMPPAAFPASDFPKLKSLSGDRGAGSLLAKLPKRRTVMLPADTLIDIDRPDDLARLQKNA